MTGKAEEREGGGREEKEKTDRQTARQQERRRGEAWIAGFTGCDLAIDSHVKPTYPWVIVGQNWALSVFLNYFGDKK